MNREERIFYYGHDLTVKDIQEMIPFTKARIQRDFFDNPNYTITFDPLLAYTYLMFGYECLQWGCEYKGRTVFIFRRKRITADELPF